MRHLIRWRIAALINRLPGQCLADLVSWALDGSTIRHRLPWAPDTECRREAPTCGGCMCGKYRRGEGR